jgi:hypothetical protein
MQPIEHNGKLHGVAATVVTTLVVVLALGGWYTHLVKVQTCPKEPLHTPLGVPLPVAPWCKADLSGLETIEASLAYKKPDTKQPQKPKSAPPPEVKPEGVNHDDLAKPPDKPKKPDDPKSKPSDTPEDLYKKYHHQTDDDDNEVGKPTQPDVGQFDGSEFGFASETKGDPYFQKLIGDLVEAGGEYPSLSSDAGNPVACLHIEPSGKIVDTLFKVRSGNQELDDWVERAMKSIKDKRDKDPDPVPDHLLKQVEKWICVKLGV